MDAVFRLADRISVLVSGRVIATGRPAIRAHPEVRKAYLGEARRMSALLQVEDFEKPRTAASQVLFGVDLAIVPAKSPPSRAQRHGKNDDGALDHGPDPGEERSHPFPGERIDGSAPTASHAADRAGSEGTPDLPQPEACGRT